MAKNKKAKTSKATQEPTEKKGRGRPSKFDEEIASLICDLLWNGNSLAKALKELKEAYPDKCPSRDTVRRWARDNEDFKKDYEFARLGLADHYFDRIIEIAEDRSRDTPLFDGKGGYRPDLTAVNRDRLQIDALKWVCGRIAPWLYGDKAEAEKEGDKTRELPETKIVAQPKLKEPLK